jgi:hypothetical protein
MPTAVNQPRQPGSQPIQVKRIGSFRSSRTAADAVETEVAASMPGHARPAVRKTVAARRRARTFQRNDHIKLNPFLSRPHV